MEWECPECGRTHPRNSPPCSRCGHMRLAPTDDPREDPAPEHLTDRDRSTLLTVARYVAAAVALSLVLYGTATVVAGILG